MKRDYCVGSAAGVDDERGYDEGGMDRYFTDGASKLHIRTFQQKKKADAHEAKIRVEVGSGTHLSIDANRTIATAAEDRMKRVEANGMRGEGPVERTTIRQYRQHQE
jgi:hypothetical protein